MNDLTIGQYGLGRTPELIAAEINNIKDQTRKMVLYNSIEIGRRLLEAKQLISHGEWGKWLTESVDYSQSTANNLMRIFEEYGADQITFLSDNAKSQALGNLSYTQAVALLGINAEDREAFVKENHVEDMSTRELIQAIKEREQAEKERQEALNEKNRAEAAKAILEEQLRENKKANTDAINNIKKIQEELKAEREENEKKIIELQKAVGNTADDNSQEEIESLNKTIGYINDSLRQKDNKIMDLEKELSEKPIEVTETIKEVEKIPEEVLKELEALRKIKSQHSGQVEIKFKALFEVVINDFKSLVTTLQELKEGDHEAYIKCKEAVNKLIIKMGDGL